MRHLIFQQAASYPIALLVKDSSFKKQELLDNYVTPLGARGIPTKDIIGFTLDYGLRGKAPVKLIKAYLAKLLPALQSLGTELLFVTDAAYFKVLTRQPKAEPHHGYVLPCKIAGFEHMQVILSLNYQALIYNPDLQARLDLSLDTLASVRNGTYQALGTGIIHSAQYPEGSTAIAAALESLHQYPHLTCDIEAFSLRFNEAGIGTISFAWDEHNGIAFACDYYASREDMGYDPNWPGSNIPNEIVRAHIKEFFETYQGEITWHHAGYDAKVLIYTLWMKDLLDTEGLLEGLEVMTRHIHDTKIIAYLATNSTAGNVLGLKALAHEFAGNWAKEDINDIRRIPLADLLQYNLVDALSTWYVRKKYYPIMVRDQQEALYTDLMLPSLKVILQIELTGMPMDPEKLIKLRTDLEAIQAEHLAVIENHPVIKMLNLLVQNRAMVAANAKLKVKQHPLSHFAGVKFNPNSGQQLQILLYEQMKLPVIDYTATKQPATGAETIEKLINHTTNAAYKEILEAIIGYGKVSKILSTFIPAFEQGILKADGMRYLHGSFNLGGTVSGRLSSSDPNLQNLPSGSTYGKKVKQAFMAATGWLFCGADFASLEDRINALLTKDPNKLKVYTDGYDGHSLRAFAYFGDQMPDIVDTVASINSIPKKYKPLRQDSKPVTFALTYQGTWMTLAKNLGWPEDKAKRVEANYHKLYTVSTQWVKDKIAEAAKRGYAEGAFGLRIRTPLLAQTFLGTRSTPREAEAEARTLGNAISGQSYGLLNNRAVVEFMRKVWASPYRLKIKPVALIHDAIYLVITDEVQVVEWVNRELTQAMAWQKLPEIAHPQVKLGAELDIYWPSWATATTLPNTASAAEIYALCQKTKAKVLEQKQAA